MARNEVIEILCEVVNGEELRPDDAYKLIRCEKGDIPAILAASSFIRDIYKGKCITYSRKVFIPLVRLCRNKCAYCGFRKEPGHPEANYMSPSQVRKMLGEGKRAGCKEALFTLGEKPEEKYVEARSKIKQLGYNSTIEYLHGMCELALKVGLLPHSNPGVMTKDELAHLKDVNASMGLMLENIDHKLLEKGGPHEFSPGKDPKLRLATIKYAGELKIAFTTGLLVGIGEAPERRVDSLFALKELNDRYGHIQEIIIQGFRAKPGTPMENFPEPTDLDIALSVAVARLIFKGSVNIQSPPNLLPDSYPLLIFAGINDWGGISPLTCDFINPQYPWPQLDELRGKTEMYGYRLRERLPIYPEFIVKKEGFLPEPLKEIILHFVDRNGLVQDTA